MYVDDILITSNDQEDITTLLGLLNQEFSIRDLDNICFFFGIELIPHVEGYLHFQRKYITWLL